MTCFDIGTVRGPPKIILKAFGIRRHTEIQTSTLGISVAWYTSCPHLPDIADRSPVQQPGCIRGKLLA